VYPARSGVETGEGHRQADFAAVAVKLRRARRESVSEAQRARSKAFGRQLLDAFASSQQKAEDGKRGGATQGHGFLLKGFPHQRNNLALAPTN
jgi:hypothetical protein